MKDAAGSHRNTIGILWRGYGSDDDILLDRGP